MTPYIRVPYHGPVTEGSQDQDNFVRNLITLLGGWGWWADAIAPPPTPPAPLSGSIEAEEPVLPLDRIKLHCHIELDQVEEDDELKLLEMAARLHTQNALRRPPFDKTVGENIKLAMLVLIGHWYRNREAIIAGLNMAPTPMAYDMLLAPERNFPDGTY